jgi:acyl-CoA hydrolase
VSIGKPILIVDALYRLAEADRRVQLTIFTGLTLTLPRSRSSLERRFAEPLLDRLFSGCVEPLYAAAVRQGRLPPNIRVHEFFLLAGQSLANRLAQKSYISLNYSQVARHLERAETNVLAQLVAPHPSAARVSLSSNPDITLDMLPYIASRRAHEPTVFAVELNKNLPYMPGEAEIERAQIDMVLEPADPHYGLFAPPKEPVSLADYAMALHAATLVKDGGTLQIGIGAFSDALAHALVLRHRDNATFRDLLDKLGTPLPGWAELDPFSVGLLWLLGAARRRFSRPEESRSLEAPRTHGQRRDSSNACRILHRQQGILRPPPRNARGGAGRDLHDGDLVHQHAQRRFRA